MAVGGRAEIKFKTPHLVYIVISGVEIRSVSKVQRPRKGRASLADQLAKFRDGKIPGDFSEATRIDPREAHLECGGRPRYPIEIPER